MGQMDKRTCPLNCALSITTGPSTFVFKGRGADKTVDLNIILKGGRPIQIHYRFEGPMPN